MKIDLRSKKHDSRLLEARFKIQDSRFKKPDKEESFFPNIQKSWFLVLVSWFLILTCFSFVSCSSDEDDTIAPKPRSYFRLSFPEKKYITYDSVCPFTFEMPVYSHIDRDKNFGAEPCWLNLNFPTFNGTLHLSYKAVNGNIKEYLEDTYTLASKHQIKASGIEEQLISRDSNKVYGLIYEIKGNAASSIQFFLTDSTRHFIRGALYFNAVPNTDSIAPVLEYIKKDIYQMIATFKWKNEESGHFPKAVHKK
ncbi:MAG: gliding motility lipoprotein GldD [Bacteroidota bacterium]